MSDRDDALVKPVVTKNTPRLGRLAVLVSSESDMRLLDSRLGIDPATYRPLFMSRLYPDPSGQAGFSITGPIVGAPYAVMLLENLIAWGVRRCIFVGWCGAISADVKIGDIVLPSAAIIDEGTSLHYGAEQGSVAEAPGEVCQEVEAILKHRRLPYRRGRVWTTDGIYRETPDKIDKFRNRAALAVEMEISALYTVGHFRGVDIGALLFVSDELGQTRWRPGFKSEMFKSSRNVLCDVLSQIGRHTSRGSAMGA